MIDPTGHSYFNGTEWVSQVEETENTEAVTPNSFWEKEAESKKKNHAIVFYEPGDSYKDAKDEKKYFEEQGYVVTINRSNKWSWF